MTAVGQGNFNSKLKKKRKINQIDLIVNDHQAGFVLKIIKRMVFFIKKKKNHSFIREILLLNSKKKRHKTYIRNNHHIPKILKISDLMKNTDE